MNAADHSERSTNREKLLEHLFVGDLLRCLWRSGVRDVEVLRAEVDSGGFDLVVECGGVLRHIQLKTSHRGAKTAKVDINTALAKKTSGCVIWLLFDELTLELGPFLWFGAEPGHRLPDLGDRVGRHTRGNKGEKGYRKNIRQVRRSAFRSLSSMEYLARALFGAAA